MNRIILGLGSNIGDREKFINKAIDIISRNILSNVKRSKIYRSKALLKDHSPKSWNLEFYNIAISGYSDFEPLSLLSLLKEAEIEIGRIKRPLWAPREIDIDILAYGNDVYHHSDLIIPHKELLNRDFAIIPFSEVYPQWIYPVRGKFYGLTILDIAKRLFK